jgi:hypothetical protein
MPHTPGPWTATENRGGWLGPVIEAEGATQAVAIVNGDYDDNAHLIAAAPEMLALLRSARLIVEGAGHMDLSVKIWNLIAKAEGRDA